MLVYRCLLAKGKRGIFQLGGSVTDWTFPSSCELRSIETGVSCSGAITLTYAFCFKLIHLNCIKLDRVAPLVTDSPSAKSTLYQNPFLFQPHLNIAVAFKPIMQQIIKSFKFNIIVNV